MTAGVRPDPDNPPVGLDKDMSKFEVEDIPRYVKYPVVFDNWEQVQKCAVPLATAAQ
jgi:hypothetical protein